MKFKSLYIGVIAAASLVGCTVTDFEDNYTDPSKLSETTVGKQFSGMIYSNRAYVLPSYDDYFINHRINSNRFTQAIGWVNGENQYVPGSSAINNRWDAYYITLGQYREIEKVYGKLPDIAKSDQRIYLIAATTFIYDQTQKVVDLHGDIPFSQAGMISINGGDYNKSYASYDSAEDIYTKMLDDLKSFADELNTIVIPSAVQVEFKTQDLINGGDIESWKKYVNSLRLRMLTRVSGTSAFAARATSEIQSILSSPATYPFVTTNSENIQWEIFNLGTLISATSFQSGLEDWNGNIAGKAIIDHMVGNDDPRLPYVFEPGTAANGTYLGLDPLMNASAQTDLIATNTLTIYNRSTISRNQYFPGMLINAAEIQFLLAEYYLGAGQAAAAKAAYEGGIRKSLEFYQYLRGLSNTGLTPVPTAPTEAEIAAYLADDDIAWDAAMSADAKLKLIAEQKWLHFNVVQPNENWAELRRLDLVDLDFWTDQSNQQNLPPYRWIYPGSEQIYNQPNYAAVQGEDKLTTKIFWDNN